RYAILKNKESYIFINAGDVKKNHKHADDLSFVLYYDQEVIVDPGIYSYDNNSMREYQTSARAHNTIVLNNENYKYINNKQDDTKIVLFKEYDNYYYVLMKNKSYDYAEIYRHFYVLKSDFTILICDEVFSKSKVLATQYFNLSPSLYKKNKISIQENQIIIGDNFKIKYDEESFYELYNGKNPYNINAIYSKEFHHFEPTAKISINKYLENPSLTTLISKSIIKDLEVKDINIKSNTIKLIVEGNIIEFKKEIIKIDDSEYNELPRVDIKREGNKIFCEKVAEYFEYQEYAWDIMKGKQKEKVIWYQECNNFEYNFNEKGEYTIRCYIRNKYNHEEKKSFKNEQKIIVF